MNKTFKIIVNVMCILFVTFVFIGEPTHANTNTMEEQPFTVVPIYPDNQDSHTVKHISVSVDDNVLKQAFAYELKNNTNESLDVLIRPLNALTSPNGVIQYRDSIDMENSTIIDEQYSLADYVDMHDSVELMPGERKVVKLIVDIDDIDGTILGAIGFQVTEKGDVLEQDKIQFQVNNETNVIMGIQVNFKTDKKPDFEIDDPYVDAMSSYYAIRLPVTLHAPLIMSDIELDYEVFDANQKLLFDNKYKEFKFAPNTKANIGLPWDYESIEKGKLYTLKGELRYDDETIPFEKTFKFEDGKVNMPNGPGFKIPDVGSNFWLWMFVLSIALLALIASNRSFSE